MRCSMMVTKATKEKYKRKEFLKQTKQSPISWKKRKQKNSNLVFISLAWLIHWNISSYRVQMKLFFFVIKLRKFHSQKSKVHVQAHFWHWTLMKSTPASRKHKYRDPEWRSIDQQLFEIAIWRWMCRDLTAPTELLGIWSKSQAKAACVRAAVRRASFSFWSGYPQHMEWIQCKLRAGQSFY